MKQRLRISRRRGVLLAGVAVLGLGGLAIAAYVAFRFSGLLVSDSNVAIRRWVDDPAARPALRTLRLEGRCPGAPFILPSDGFVGLFWGDPAPPYTLLNRHTGIDVFGEGTEGEVPVYAVYDGYLTRRSEWLSTVIIRHADPLNPGQTIWTYYTHMASGDGQASYVAADFPRGTEGVWVEQGTLLGYQGTYSGAAFPIALHVHLSIVRSDAEGNFLNEAVLDNTLDPSPYFGLNLRFEEADGVPVGCQR
ncbi:MAG: M23 family metallopeptidase [Anaerolineae bacterium]|nr:M23 family metallopeptidase [Anaerolineae bacterium]